MGGHSISRSGFVLDMKCMSAMRYDAVAETATCGPGTLWADLIVFLNPRGKSPRTMQSYCTFSVGGTLAVNAHGITTDFCMAESVVSFRLMRVTEGRGGAHEVTTTVCYPGDDLFRLALGGYGLFGVITEVTLKLVDNMQLELDTMNLRVDSGEFARLYDSVRVHSEHSQQTADSTERSDADVATAPHVAVKIARLNILNLNSVQMFVYRRAFACKAVTGHLGLHAHMMPLKTQVLYRWLMPAMKEARFAIEEATGQALDMADEAGVTRNELLFESAVPLAKLCDPLLVSDDTFVLQEFFVPVSRFSDWIARARPVYKTLADTNGPSARRQLMLLNTTIRFVEHDTLTFLNYASAHDGCYAFVLYYRIPRTTEAEAELGLVHNELAEMTVELGGSFYLPYRRCYSTELLERAYPQIREFAALKQRFDPLCIFSNAWFDHYVRPMCGAGYGDAPSRGHSDAEGEVAGPFEGAQPALPAMVTHHDLPRAHARNLITRKGSYRALLHNQRLREQFREQFLVTIFSLADNKVVMDTMATAAWDPRNTDDLAIFRALRARFHGAEPDGAEEAGDGSVAKPKLIRSYSASGGGGGRGGGENHWSNTHDINITDDDKDVASSPSSAGQGIVAKAKQAIASIKQLHRQKRELTREMAAILGRLGKAQGAVQDYASFGDNGKLVLKLRDALGVRGRVFVCHDRECSEDDIPAILERGSLDPVGEFVKFDYMDGLVQQARDADDVCARAAAESNPGAWLTEVRQIIPTGAVDLVTINQGLHHIPPARLLPFLREVHRILRRGGMFIFREHDLCLDRSSDLCAGCPVEVLDLAHSVFNAVTGVVAADERTEVRAFRPLDEWRTIVSSVGLVDAMMQGLEEGDPTLDEMLCFVKPPLQTMSAHGPSSIASSDTAEREAHVAEPPIVDLIKTLMSQVPAAVDKTLKQTTHKLKAALKRSAPALKDILLNKLPLMTGNPSVAKIEPMVSKYLDVVVDAVDVLTGLADAVEVRDQVAIDFLHAEFFLILPVIERKVCTRPEEASSFEKTIIRVVREYAPALLLTATGGRSQTASPPPTPTTNGSCTATTVDRVAASAITGEEVLATLLEMERALPGLLSARTVSHSGFSLRQQSVLVGKFGGSDLRSTAATLATFLDRESWQALKQELKTASRTGDMPTKRLLLLNSPEHAWHRCLKAFLRSPLVRLEAKGKFGLQLIGLKALGDLHDKVKAEIEATRRATRDVKGAPATPTAARLTIEDLSSVHAGMQVLAGWCPVRTCTFRFETADDIMLSDVGEVVHATFGYSSLTSSPSDITKQIAALHASQVRESGNPGVLVVSESQCEKFRNSGSSALRGLDNTRKAAVQLATLGLAGRNKFDITYRILDGSHEETPSTATDARRINHAVDEVRDALRRSGATKYLHAQDGEYTWFKLCEWMQVEIMEVMAQSLNHTPWYRFPFFDALHTYFDVLRTECDVVARKHGLAKAYASMAFVTDLVPGIVMTAIFAQLHLLATPLRVTFSDDYSAHPDRFVEEIVLFANIESEIPLGAFFTQVVDARISDVRIVQRTGYGQVIILCTPPFKALGEVLAQIARKVPTARVLEISNQAEVQVRVSCRAHPEAEAAAERWIARLGPGVEVVARYQMPISAESASEPARKQIALGVAVPRIMQLLRGCSGAAQSEAVRLEQVYDYYC